MYYKNIYYFRVINALGGIETFFYELAKKYCDWDLTIIYSSADEKQLARLKKYIRCIKYEKGMIINCEKAFFNFNTDIIDNVNAKEYTLVVHGNYRMLNDKPPIHEKINRVIAVSSDSAKAYTELTNIDCGVCYNPITITEDDKRPIVKIVVASRLQDKVKGATRVYTLINAIDNYAKKHNKLYMITIFSDEKDTLGNENVFFRKPTLNIRPYINDADFVMQLSDNFEGYNYTLNESLLLGTPIIYTPCNVYTELGINETMGIRVEFDLSNIDSVCEQIFSNKKYDFKYEPPKDRWNELLEKGNSTYEGNIMVKVKATNKYVEMNMIDIELQKIPTENEQWETNRDRAEMLMDLGYIKDIMEIKEPLKDDGVLVVDGKPKRTKKKEK